MKTLLNYSYLNTGGNNFLSIFKFKSSNNYYYINIDNELLTLTDNNILTTNNYNTLYCLNILNNLESLNNLEYSDIFKKCLEIHELQESLSYLNYLNCLNK